VADLSLWVLGGYMVMFASSDGSMRYASTVVTWSTVANGLDVGKDGDGLF